MHSINKTMIAISTAVTAAVLALGTTEGLSKYYLNSWNVCNSNTYFKFKKLDSESGHFGNDSNSKITEESNEEKYYNLVKAFVENPRKNTLFAINVSNTQDPQHTYKTAYGKTQEDAEKNMGAYDNSRLEHPHIVTYSEGWDAVRRFIENYETSQINMTSESKTFVVLPSQFACDITDSETSQCDDSIMDTDATLSSCFKFKIL